MTLREAAQQALKAMELAGMSHDVMLMSDPPQDAWKARGVYWKLAEAISALRTALAEPTSQESRQVEPVAWMRPDRGHICFYKYPEYVPLYTAPPKRKPLTDWEIEVWAQKPISRIALCRAIERAHGIGGEE